MCIRDSYYNSSATRRLVRRDAHVSSAGRNVVLDSTSSTNRTHTVLRVHGVKRVGPSSAYLHIQTCDLKLSTEDRRGMLKERKRWARSLSFFFGRGSGILVKKWLGDAIPPETSENGHLPVARAAGDTLYLRGFLLFCCTMIYSFCCGEGF